jgi:pyruvate kinase
MPASLNSMTSSVGPELRGANITLDTILKPTDAARRQTKIIGTLGPACWDVPTLEALIQAGLSVARFNFSHGDHAGHQACLDRLRQAAKNQNRYIGMSVCCVCVLGFVYVYICIYIYM